MPKSPNCREDLEERQGSFKSTPFRSTMSPFLSPSPALTRRDSEPYDSRLLNIISSDRAVGLAVERAAARRVDGDYGMYDTSGKSNSAFLKLKKKNSFS